MATDITSSAFLASKVDSEQLIRQLKNIRYIQSAVFEDCFKDYLNLNLKLQQQSKESRRRDRQLSAQSQTSNEESKDWTDNSGSNKQDYQQTLVEEAFEYSGIQIVRAQRIKQLERENRNLKDESAHKSIMFQTEIMSQIQNANRLPFSRLIRPFSVLLYLYDHQQQVLLQSESDEPFPVLKQYSLKDKRNQTFCLPSSSRGIPFAQVRLLNDRMMWCLENANDIEVWTAKPPMKRISVIYAHSDPISSLLFITQNIILSSSSKGVLKVWRIDSKQLLKSLKLDSAITCSRLLSVNSHGVAHILAGCSSGMIRVIQISDLPVKVGAVMSSTIQKQSNTASPINIEIIYEILPALPAAVDGMNLEHFVNCLSVAFLGSRDPESELRLDQFFFAASIASDPESIFIVHPGKNLIVSTRDSNMMKQYRNSSLKKQFTLTKEFLVAGTFNGSVFTWDVKNFPKIQFKASHNTLSTVPILLAHYEANDDMLITGDEQGNILLWEHFINNNNPK